MTRKVCPPPKGGFSVSPKLDNSLTFGNDSLYSLYKSNIIPSLFINNPRNQETAAIIDSSVSIFWS